MKYKNNGFTYVECIVSLSIIFISASLIYTSIYSNYNNTVKNEDYNKMVNEAKIILETKKHEIKSGNESFVNNYTIEEGSGYKIYTKIEEEKEYYNCYKINVNIVDENNNLEFMSYVTK
ncbi:MAG: hypothetical protein RRZ84_00135 [Romboutsia sp.]